MELISPYMDDAPTFTETKSDVHLVLDFVFLAQFTSCSKTLCTNDNQMYFNQKISSK